jgi:hypothetical protein
MLDYKETIQEFVSDMEQHLDNNCFNADEKLEYLDECEEEMRKLKAHFEAELKVVPFAGQATLDKMKKIKQEYDQELMRGISEIDLGLSIIDNARERVQDDWIQENNEYGRACTYADFNRE